MAKEASIKFLRMKPGHGEVLLAEGDPRMREDEERLVEEFRRQLDEGMWAAVPTTAGQRAPRGAMVRDYARDPARRRARDLLPARRRRLSGARRAARTPRPRARRARARAAAARESRAAGEAARRVAARGARAAPSTRHELARPRPRAARRAARSRALRSCVNDEEWAMYRDLGFIRVRGPARPAVRASGAPAVRLPDLPAQADRGLRPDERPPPERVLRRVPDLAARPQRGCPPPTTCSPSGWR